MEDTAVQAPLIRAAHRWNTNADLIEDVARLGYLRADWRVLDATYGRGLWWSNWSPKDLTRNDIKRGGFKDGYHFDFRKFPPAWADKFDAVAFDPPYVSTGGRKTSNIGEFNDRFGLKDAPSSPAGVQRMINDGMDEARRVLKIRGILLVKMKNYISSGKLWPGVHHTWNHALDLGLQYVDEFTMVGDPGAQSQTSQVHARQNSSTLFVFQKR